MLIAFGRLRDEETVTVGEDVLVAEDARLLVLGELPQHLVGLLEHQVDEEPEGLLQREHC